MERHGFIILLALDDAATVAQYPRFEGATDAWNELIEKGVPDGICQGVLLDNKGLNLSRDMVSTTEMERQRQAILEAQRKEAAAAAAGIEASRADLERKRAEIDAQLAALGGSPVPTTDETPEDDNQLDLLAPEIPVVDAPEDHPGGEA